MRESSFACLLGGLVAAGSALAQLPDPMRPPASAMTPEAGGAAAAPVASGLRTVILRPGGKSIAIIDGRHVAVGEMFGDRRVLKISESEVILQGEGGREVIKVVPAAEKVPATRAAPTKRRTTGAVQQ